MKKIIRIYLAVLCLAAGLAVCMSSADTVYAYRSGDFEYRKISNADILCVTRYTGSDKDVVIPRAIDGMYVVTIGNGIFKDSDITSVTIPAGVYKIEEEAFKGCRKLASVSIPTTVNTIEKSVFYGCESLKEIHFPVSVARIGEMAFYGCGLTEVSIPKYLKVIEKNTFGSCGSLTKVQILDSVTDIEESAFDNCQKLTEIHLPNSIKSIGKKAFYDCNKHEKCVLRDIYYDGTKEQWNKIKNDNIEDLKKAQVTVHFQDGTTQKLGDSGNMPQGEESIEIDTIVSGERFDYEVTVAGENAEVKVIRMNVAPSEIEIPSYMIASGGQVYKVTAIADGVMAGCKTLEKVIIGGHIKSIGKNAFKGCPKLKSIVIKSKELKSVGRNAFKGIPAYAKIKVPSKKLAAYKKLLKGKGQSRMVKITK